MTIPYYGNAHEVTLTIYTTNSKTYTQNREFTIEHNLKEQPFLDILIKLAKLSLIFTTNS